jgi:hypothetical protein
MGIWPIAKLHTMMRRNVMTRKLMAGIVVVACSLIFVGSVWAEGSWSESSVNYKVYTESRRWYDANSDSTQTRVQFDRCNAGTTNDNAEVGVWKDNLFFDDLIGSQLLRCESSGAATYGDPVAGDYYFEVAKINGSTSGSLNLFISKVTVNY